MPTGFALESEIQGGFYGFPLLVMPVSASDAIYNLQGARMNGNNLPAGIYVKNGKKFVVK